MLPRQAQPKALANAVIRLMLGLFIYGSNSRTYFSCARRNLHPPQVEASSNRDFASISKGGWPQLMRITHNGKRLFVSMNQAGKVVMFDTSDPQHPVLIKALDLGAASGPHYIALTADEKRLVVSDYFLNEDNFGKIHAEGDHKVHVAKVTTNDLVLDQRFDLDFNIAFATGPARPHGLAIK